MSILSLLCAVPALGLVHPPWHILGVNPTANYDSFAYTPGKASLKWWHQTGFHNSTKRPYSAFVAIVGDPRDVHVMLPNNTCSKVAKTSDTAREHNCLYAINAGFFDVPNHKCIGNVVSNGHVVQLPATASASFGIAHDRNGKAVLITGFLGQQELNSTFKYEELVSGAGWLVRNGKSNLESSSDLDIGGHFVTIKAPRTAVGYYASNSSILILEVDGEEDIDAGPDLFEMTELLLQLGVDSAINLDGGGSAVAYAGGKVISVPTCRDTPEVCERAVTSILCVRHQ